MSWIEKHPEATRIERIKALAYAMIGTTTQPSPWTKECYGLEEDFEITDEPMEHCLAFDTIVLRCDQCDWWCDADAVGSDSICEECAHDNDYPDDY